MRAEITNAPYRPAAFRLWRRRRLLAVEFAPWGRNKPLNHLLVEDSVGDRFRSEEFQVAAHENPAVVRYTFDVGSLPPRSPELAVVQQAKIDRMTREAKTVIEPEFGGGVIPGKVGVTLPLGKEKEIRETYKVAANVDPELEARILLPFAENDDLDLMPLLVAGVAADLDDLLSEDWEVINREVRRYVETLLSGQEHAAAEIAIEGGTLFRLEEGERRHLDVVLRARASGVGLFGLALIDRDTGMVSVADPVVYAVSLEAGTVTLYDAVVDDTDEEPGPREEDDLSPHMGAGPSELEPVPVQAPEPIGAIAGTVV
jgi:hypothetical protein